MSRTRSVPEQQLFRTGVEPERDAVRLELRQPAFIDSTGGRLIMGVDERANKDGIDLTLIKGAEHIQRVVEIAGLTDALVPTS